MTGKEAIKELRQEYYLENGEHIIVFKDDDERLDIIEKDLEDLEELKKIMGTPIQDIMKRLKVLEALKRNVGIRLAIQEWANKEAKVFPNDRKIVKEWLENEK